MSDRVRDEALREHAENLAALLVCLMVDADAIHETRADRLNRLQAQYTEAIIHVFTGIREGDLRAVKK